MIDIAIKGADMPITVNNPEADALTRRFAAMAGVGITEAIERRHPRESAEETAARLRTRHGIRLSEAARKPLPADAYDEMWEGR